MTININTVGRLLSPIISSKSISSRKKITDYSHLDSVGVGGDSNNLLAGVSAITGTNISGGNHFSD